MVAVVLVALYVILMFVSMGWLAPKNMGQSNEQAARMMKIMGYTMPIMMAFVGVNLQIGVLIYWMVAMLFSLLQQWGILYWMPTPDSPAHRRCSCAIRRSTTRLRPRVTPNTSAASPRSALPIARSPMRRSSFRVPRPSPMPLMPRPRMLLARTWWMRWPRAANTRRSCAIVV
ncbi:YidC/Oxa1 family membrane protein insertase [Nanchangia anserum]|nr:YidC/Oxa1 family membrane protein insertase [Nanchangia anserum]